MQSYALPLFPFLLCLCTVHVCKFEEVMFVFNIYAVFPFSCHVVSASADTYGGGFFNLKGFRVQPGAKILRFNGVGKALIFALACCLTVVTSGCGAGVSKSVGGGLFVSPVPSTSEVCQLVMRLTVP